MRPRGNSLKALLLIIWLCSVVTTAMAAPDEQILGRDQGYPVGKAARSSWLDDPSMRVGSFTHQGEIPGLYNGRSNVLRRADRVMALASAAVVPDYRWNLGANRGLTVADYLARQRIMGLIIIKDGVVQFEGYQYDRKPSHRFNSHSMAKSITGLAVGIALGEGRIKSLDDRADQYAVKLRNTPLGATSIRNLLRMSSGVRYKQTLDGSGESGLFDAAIAREGVEVAAGVLSHRAAAAGAQFNYSSADSAILGTVLRAATGMSISDYLSSRLWQAVGAEETALWRADRTGLEVTYGNFNATLRDYARLAIVLANDGVRPDDSKRKAIVPIDFLLDATDWKRAPVQFHPGRATPGLGYGYQFWCFPGERRRFGMIGVYGQSIFIDPAQRLVMVQMGVNATAEAGGTSLARERMAFWRGLVNHYGAW
jgi:CubicO group peptidase (beta-lactamase class C family)